MIEMKSPCSFCMHLLTLQAISDCCCYSHRNKYAYTEVQEIGSRKTIRRDVRNAILLSVTSLGAHQNYWITTGLVMKFWKMKAKLEPLSCLWIYSHLSWVRREDSKLSTLHVGQLLASCPLPHSKSASMFFWSDFTVDMPKISLQKSHRIQ